MAALIDGLPDLPALRLAIAEALTEADLMGEYIWEDERQGEAIAVENLGFDEGEEYPPAGSMVVGGIEVAIGVVDDIPPVKALLDGDMVTYRHAITLKEHDATAQGRLLKAFSILKPILGSTDSAVIRMLPNPQLGNLETLSFSLEQIVYIPAED